MRQSAAVRALAIAASVALAACAGDNRVTAPVDVEPAFATGGAQERYIVVFRGDVGDPDGLTDQLTQGLGAQVHHRYRHALKGFAASLPAQAIQGISRNPNVAYVEADGTVTTVAAQANPTWGLDRIDQRDLPRDQSYTYNQTGAGVHAYIIDTGIRASHGDFGGRVSGTGFTAIADGNGTSDCNGHGTHVAGTVGGTVYGVAKGVTLHAVRVLSCSGSGSTSGVIAGIDWVTGNADKPAVANMSLGGGASTSLDNAVANSVASGVTYVVAAGNSNRSACNYSPARAASAITVGATTSTDARASYSNYGSCVDLFAPGSSITSAWYTSNTATATISGTSMASPHVAGVAALYLQGNTSASPAQVTAAIEGAATPNKVTSAGSGSPNLLLYSLLGTAPDPEPEPEPDEITVFVADLDGGTTTAGKNWKAVVAVTIGGATSGATVSGTWSTGGSGSCITNANGTCSIESGNLRRYSSTTFAVTAITGTNMTYDATLNAETAVTVDQP